MLTQSIIEKLYCDHHGWLRGWLRKKLSCHHHAADLAHDTFIKILALSELPYIKEPRAYLLVIANRLLINQYHKKRVEDETLQAVAQLAWGEAAHNPENIYAARELLSQVLAMLTDELEEKPRRAFLLSRVDGLSYAEIAQILNVSESSVKQYLTKALLYCHQRLSSLSKD